MTRQTTQELTEALRRHYEATIKGNAGSGGTFVTEVGVNGAWGASRRCDALHIGFTTGSGRILRGHEIKVSRADWLNEVNKPDKADFWADSCHEWWIVTPEPDIIHPGELPRGWGHMCPSLNPRHRKFQIITPATPKPDGFNPPWDAVRSVFSRLDSTQAREREKVLAAEREAMVRKMEASFQERRELMESRTTSVDQDRYKALTEMEELLGGTLSSFNSRLGKSVTPDQLRAALRLVGDGSLRWNAESIAHTAETLTDVQKKLAQIGSDVRALSEEQDRMRRKGNL